MEKHIEKILWSVVALIILGAIFCASSFGQTLNPTYISVNLDSLRGRSDTVWLSDGSGSNSYFITRNDSLIFGDVSGEKYLANLATGGTPGGSPGDIQYNSAGSFGGMNVSTDGNYMQFGTSGTYIDSTDVTADTLNAKVIENELDLNINVANELSINVDNFNVNSTNDININSTSGQIYLSTGITDPVSIYDSKLYFDDFNAYVTGDGSGNLQLSDASTTRLLNQLDVGGLNNTIQYNNSGNFDGAPMSTDGTDITVDNTLNASEISADTITAIKVKGDTTETDIIILASGDTIESRQDPQTWIQETQFDSLDALLLKAGRIARDTTYHAIGGFEDSTVTVNCPVVSTWYHVTNATNNLVTGLDAQGFSISGDTLISNVSGDFRGGATITFSGTTGNEYQFRAYNVTQARQIGFKQGITANGTSVYRNLTLILYENLSVGDKIVLQVENITAANPAILRHYQFEAVYLHD